jgi:hypothetical protein
MNFVSNMPFITTDSKVVVEIKSFILFIEENLNGYTLPEETLPEIRYILTGRFKTRFSEVLSPEGRLAMKQTAQCSTEFDGKY